MGLDDFEEVTEAFGSRLPIEPPYELAEPDDECNGICLTAADIGLPEYSRPGEVAYAHPDCPEHGDPMGEDPNEDICGDGAEDLRYAREDDIEQPE